MKLSHLPIARLFILLSFVSIRAEIDIDGKDAPPEVIARAEQLAAQKDYAGIEAMVTQIDTQFRNNHGVDYFSRLLAVRNAVPGVTDPSRIEYPRLWLERKLLWKILLTPYSQREDVEEVQEVKDTIAFFGFPIPNYQFGRDRDQFIALRLDTAALLEAYGGSLKARIIPKYQRKPGGTLNSGVILDEAAAAAAIAQEKKIAGQLAQNELENTEQDVLRESLRQLDGFAVNLILNDFSWSPDDDETVNALLAAFPSLRETHGHIFAELSEGRKANAAEFKRQEEAAKASQAKTK